MTAPTLTHALIWQQIHPPSMEYFGLWRDGPGWQLRGTVVAALADRPVQVRYAVLCDSAWSTSTVHIGMRAGGPEQALHLTAGDGRWRLRDGDELTTLEGFLDVDLGITPSTNTLPIRRLNLKIGGSADVTAAWIRFPELSIEPLVQRYTRLGERTYRYQSTSGYTANIEVDEQGLVTRYADLWQRVAQSNPEAP